MAAHSIKKGSVLDGRYEVIRRLGEGGMGEVYAARRIALGDIVSIKVLLSDRMSDESRAHLLTEARAAAHIRHPNVVQVFDFGDRDGASPYIVMEYLEGPTLGEQLAASGRFAPDRALQILAGVCAAVEAGHRRGVIHRDLKPANVMLAATDDGEEVVKVLDFGVAFVSDPRLSGEHINPRIQVVGTPHYMSPEQAVGKAVSPASDVFSLGVLLYEMVTGQVPFDGESTVDVLLAVMHETHRDPNELVPSLPMEIGDAIAEALSKDPNVRPSAVDLARRAGAVQLLPASARDSSTGVAPATSNKIASTIRRRVTQNEPHIKAFAGRTAERTRLKDALRAAAAGESKITLITGDAGSGKTRLAEELAGYLTRREVTVLWGRFFDYEGSQPPPYEAFVSMAGDSDVVQRVVSDPMISAEGERWRVFAEVADAFAARAAARPLVLVFDDVQWASRLDLELIEHLYRSLAAHPTLVIATARADAIAPTSGTELARWVAALARRRVHSMVALQPLSQDEIRRWLERAFVPLRIRPRDLARLHQATGGSPYYLVETVRHLLANETIALDENGWAFGSLDGVTWPDTIKSLLEARLAGVERNIREALEVAAVIGNEFRFDSLQLALGVDEEPLEALLDAAVAKRFITERGVSPGNDYRFGDPGMRRVLYDAISGRRRARAHLKVVSALQRVHNADNDRLAHVFAYHYHALSNWQRALTLGLRAAEQALEHHDIDRAGSALHRAREARAALLDAFTPPPADDTAKLDLLMGTLHVREGDFEQAVDALQDLTGLHAQLMLVEAKQGLGELTEAAVLARDIAGRALQWGDRGVALDAQIRAATLTSRLGDIRQAAAQLRAMLDDIRDDDPPALRCQLHRHYGWQLLKLGAFDEALRHADHALQMARAAGDMLSEYGANAAKASVYGESGDYDRALVLQLRGLEMSRRMCLRRREAIDIANASECYYEMGRYDQALEGFEHALAIFIEIGDRACEGDCLVNVGRALLACGHHDDAIATLRKGESICEERGRYEYSGVAALTLGKAHLESGDADAASAAYRAAQERLAPSGPFLLWRAEHGLARVALRKKRHRAGATARRAGARSGRRSATAPPSRSRRRRELRAVGQTTSRSAGRSGRPALALLQRFQMRYVAAP